MYTTSQLASRFNVTAQTIKRYAKEFAAYLSPTATPEKEMARRFTDDDLAVYALICSMKEEGKLFEHIHAALRMGERGVPPDSNSGLTVAQSSAQMRLVKRIQELEHELSIERATRHESDLARAAAEGREKLLRELLEEANRRLYKSN